MGRLLGCGIDIEEPERFRKYFPLQETIPGLFRMVFTEAEISRNRDLSPHLTFPLGFSCKEAVFKAFGRSWTNSRITWQDIELVFNDDHNLQDYRIELGGYARELYEAMGCRKIESSYEINQGFIVFEVMILG